MRTAQVGEGTLGEHGRRRKSLCKGPEAGDGWVCWGCRKQASEARLWGAEGGGWQGLDSLRASDRSSD